MYRNGYGVLQDYAAAMRWIRLAVEQGLAAAQFQLGGMYIFGEGVTRNLQQAFHWTQLSPEQGYIDAQVILGKMLGKGLIVLGACGRKKLN